MSLVFWCADDACEEDNCTRHGGPYRVGTHGDSGGVIEEVQTATEAFAAVDRSEVEVRLEMDLEEAETKAWDSLARYKFVMFGYWCGVWVHLNRLTGKPQPNVFRDLVRLARTKREERERRTA